jgi:hypothetical protein
MSFTMLFDRAAKRVTCPSATWFRGAEQPTTAYPTQVSDGELAVLYTNLATECHRKGKNGVERTGGQAGCVTVESRDVLAALAVVKELFLLCVQLEGVEVKALIASSGPTANSLGMANVEHFEGCDPISFPVSM